MKTFATLTKEFKVLETDFVTVNRKFTDGMDMVEVYKNRTYRDKREYNLLYETLSEKVNRNEIKLVTAIDMVT
jgi:hypothetical protein